MPDVLLEGSFDAAQQRRYAHVPFEVPPGIRAIHISYDYSDRISSDPLLSGGNTLDIGLFDPRGIAPSSPGFRGWSGSHKLNFSVTETWATPAYLAGPVQSGTWHILLGPYKVGPRGLDYRVEINFGLHPGEAQPHSLQVNARRPDLNAPAEPNWLRGDLHCHTLYSDGDSWPNDMLSEAVARGLDFLGVTDHNQVGHQAEYAALQGQDLPIILPGVEVTTYGGHWNAWGTGTWWDFREPTEAATSQVMHAAAEAGALVSVNHPKPFGPPWEYPHASGYHAIEVWNGHRPELNRVSLAWWDEQLRAGRRVVGLGGSDTHVLKGESTLDRLGSPTTWVQATERTPEAILDALRAGRVFISRDPAGPQLYFDESLRIRAVDAEGSVLVVLSARGVAYTTTVQANDWATTVRPAEGFLRAQLLDAYGQLLALTNPVYL